MKKQTQHEFSSGFGRMVKGVSSLLLDKDELSDTLNMQPGYWWKQRKGMSALTASAVASGLRFRSLSQFRDLAELTDLLLAHTYDSSGGEDIYKGSALPPAAITWSKLYDLTADCEACQWANVWNAMLVANDKEFLIWRGNEHKPTGVFLYLASTDKYLNYWEEMIDQDDTTVMPVNGIDWDDGVYVVSEMPLDTINFEMDNLNINESEMELYYWNGGFTRITKNGYTNNASFLDEDCDTYTSPPAVWVDFDSGGASTELTVWGREVFDFDATGGGCRRRWTHPGIGAATRLVFMEDRYIDYRTSPGLSQFIFDPGDNGRGILIYFRDTSMVVYYDGGANSFNYAVQGLPDGLVYAGWYNIIVDATFDGSSNALTCDVYINGVQMCNDEDCDQRAPGTDRWYYLSTSTDCDVRFETIKVGTDLVAKGHNFADGTRLTGATLGQDGAMTWNPPGDEVASEVQGIPGFIYLLRPLVPLDSSTSIKAISVHSPMAEVKDVWDGIPRTVSGCYVYDGTDSTDYWIYVNNVVESQAAVLDAATTSYNLKVGFPERVNAVTFYVASQAKNNANSQIDAVRYFDNTGAPVSVGAFTDTTLQGTSSFSQKGTVSWISPDKEDEKATTVAGDTMPMFWYQFEWDATLADPTQIYYITGHPVGEDPDPCYGTFAYKRRAWQLAPWNRENEVRYSSQVSPNIWNGRDSGYIGFGERPLRAAAPFYNETVIYADTEMWMLQGNTPENFGRLRLSDRIGISAPHSLVSIESGVEINETLKITLVWFYNDGIWMFDGVRIWKISNPDIDSFFDPEHPDYINPAYLDQTYGEYAFETQLAMWNVYSGPTATTPTKTLVLHFPTMWYGIYQYGTSLDAILSVINERHYVVGGGHDNGKFYLLDDGVTDLDTSGNAVAVEAYAITRDQFESFSEGQTQRLVSVWAESQDGGLLEIDEYPDGSETPQKAGEQSLQWLGKLFGAFQKNVKIWPSQKTSKFRFRNRSKTARMKLIGHSTTADRSRANE